MEEKKLIACISIAEYQARYISENIDYINNELFEQIYAELDKRLKNGEIAIKVEDYEIQELPDLMMTEVRQEATLTEIVRCKDCKYVCHDDSYKTWWCGIFRCQTAQFGFCHLGKKEEGRWKS